jgi:hypothetical protein
MTFTEAAIEVLRREGKPLHFRKIAEIAVRESLLDHVGKIPEEVMGGQLANHCRLPRPERSLVVVQSGTFALAEWGLDEDPAGLEGIVEVPPDDELTYRGRERHPVPSREVARSSGRGERERPRRREEGEEKRRRFPPPAEVAYEVLAGAERGLSLGEIAAQGAERLLMPDAFVRDVGALAAALTEDNRRREAAGRKPLFALQGETVSLAAQPEPGERPAVPVAARGPMAPADVRRSALAALRRRLRECDGPTVEWVAARVLEGLGLKELKVAKRGREHVVFTGRRRMGLGEIRHCVRLLRSGGEAGRRDVSELRRDISNYGAQIGVVISAGDAAREARAEASAAGQLPVMLLCGEALAEAMTEARVGCRPVVVPEVDEDFFRQAAEAAAEEEAARRARREDRERREEGERRPRREGREPRGEVAVAGAEGSGEATFDPPIDPGAGAEPLEGAEPDEGEPAEDAGEDLDLSEGPGPAEPGEGAGAGREGGRRRRRRRRRRGRGGGAERREGPPGQGAGPASPAAPAAAPAGEAAPPSPPPPAGGGDGGG